jgi:polysaccharide pyruvyl transferase WcaK-like protein
VRDAALFVLGGGSLVRDHNLSNFSRVLDELWIAQRAGVPTAVLGVTVGPLATRWGRYWSRRLLGRAGVLALRDRESEGVLRAIKVPEGRGRVVGDLTLLLEPSPLAEAPRSAPIVVCPCGAMLRGLPDGPPGNPELEVVLAAAADALHRGTGAPIRFVPFRSGVPGDDDALLCERIAARMSTASAIAEFSSEPARVKGELAGARLVIGARLHAIIFAASRGVPVIGIAYGSKVRRFLEDLGLGDFALDPSEVTPERLLHCSERWASEGAELLAPAREHLEAARARLSTIFDEVGALVH